MITATTATVTLDTAAPRTATFPVTRFTSAVLKRAEQAGLNPQYAYHNRGCVVIVLDHQAGPLSVFGTIRIGAKSGRILRGELIHGGGPINGGRKDTLKGVYQVRAAIQDLTRNA